jgi:tight adherence protein C
MNVVWLGATTILLGSVGFGWCLYGCLGVRPTVSPTLGHRGAERKRALSKGGTFASIEPVVRYLAAPLARLPMENLRGRVDEMLLHADQHLGLDANEFLALSLVSAAALSGSIAAIAALGSFSQSLALFGAAFGAILPTLQLQEIARTRVKAVSRGLPHAIEIAAMCMGAGLDFPGSLRMLAGRGDRDEGPLSREFAVILEQLDVGRTRREALLMFARRVPTAAVRDFVNAVIQSEQKGNPLARVLQVQGRVLNMRRSVAAEEAAARAGVLMLMPMMLLVGCIMILLMGPFVISGVGF